jgi:hypothetical protein
MRITIDFDGVLEKKSVQDKVKILVDLGFDVWILTTRYPPETNDNWKRENEIVFQVAAEIGIPVDKIVFTSWEWKYNWLNKNLDVILHLDDSFQEINNILRYSKTLPISVHSSSWFNKIKKICKI